jgi:hypothetical protein
MLVIASAATASTVDSTSPLSTATRCHTSIHNIVSDKERDVAEGGTLEYVSSSIRCTFAVE